METKIKSFFFGLLLVNYLMLGGLLLNPQTVFAAGDPPANAPANTSGKSIDPLNPTFNESPVKYQGAEASIRQFLCVPGSGGSLGETTTVKKGTTMATSSSDAQDLSNCVNRLYRFGAAIGSFAAVFFIALAGYFYIVGGENGKSRAKTMIISVIAGLVIIFTSFIFLKQINPALTEFRTIQPPFLADVPGVYPSCSEVGLGESCLLPGGSAGVGDGSGGAIGGNITGKGGAVCSLGKDTKPTEHAKCDIPAAWQTAITKAAKDNGLEEEFIKAIIQQESTWREDPAENRSFRGLMQVGVDAADTAGCSGNWRSDGPTNIACGSKYLAWVKKQVDPKTNIQIAAGYNKGAAKSVTGPSDKCPGLFVWQCPFEDAAQTKCQGNRTGRKDNYEEARNYVVSVTRFYSEFKRCK